MKNYLFSYFNVRVNKKPELKRDIGRIKKKELIKYYLTIKEITEMITSPNHYPFIAANLEGGLSNTNWKSQEMFCLDFDSGISVDAVLARFKEYEITPNFYYYTFSHSEKLTKFRVCLFTKDVIYDYDYADFLRKNLVQSAFPESDQVCKDASRFFFGGNNVQIINNNPIEIEMLDRMVTSYTVSKDGNKTRNLPQDGYTYNKEFNPTRPKTKYGISNHPKSNTTYPYTWDQYNKKLKNNDFDIEKAIEKVQILKDFDSGIQLNYRLLFGIATSLLFVKGGEKYMRNTMQKYNNQGKTQYKNDKFSIFPIIKRYKYFPQRLSNFSPYKEDHVYINIINSVKSLLGEVLIHEPHHKPPMSEIEKEFSKNFQKVLYEENDDITIFLFPTSTGKTQAIKSCTNSTLCFPTHNLKNEVSKEMTVPHCVVPGLPKFGDMKINEKIVKMYSLGLNNKVRGFLKRIGYHSQDSDKFSDRDKQIAYEYLEKIEEAKNTDQTVLTTHFRGMFDQTIHSTLIFDEDPISSLMVTDKVNIEELAMLSVELGGNESIDNLLEQIKKAPPGIAITINHTQLDYDQIFEYTYSSSYKYSNSLLDFLRSKSFSKVSSDSKEIHFGITRTLPKGKKIIILTATAMVEYYQKVYGDRLKIIDYSIAQNKGKVIQNTRKSYSRASLKKSAPEELLKIADDKNVLTFKNSNLREYGIKLTKAHFGDCRGYNELCGEDLVVLGTPHMNELVYLFYAHAMGIEFTEKPVIEKMTVEWNGFQFSFMTYQDENLRNIQLRIIESELIQAVGRARTHRTDAIVKVYSNLPLRVTDEFILEDSSCQP